MEGIFLSFQDEVTGRFIVIDEVDESIWAYLTFPNEENIDKACFLGSRKKITLTVTELEKYKNKQGPPPMIKSYSTSRSWLQDLEVTAFSVEWKNGNAAVKMNGEPFLLFTKRDKKGFSKSVSQNSMYGNTWNQNKYDEAFREEADS